MAGRRELVVDHPGEPLADVPRQGNRHEQVLDSVPQVHLHIVADAGERVARLQRASSPLPEPDDHVPVQGLVLPLLRDLLIVGSLGELGGERLVFLGVYGGVPGLDAGAWEQSLGVPPVGQPREVVGDPDGGSVLRELHVPRLLVGWYTSGGRPDHQ